MNHPDYPTARDQIAPGAVFTVKDLKKLEAHPAATLFPMLAEGSNRDAFDADIAQNGVRDPLTLYKGKLLDGRNRCRAAILGKRPAPVEEYLGDDPLGFVLSKNLHRRHLSESQRAAGAAETEGFSHGGVRIGSAGGEKAITREESARLWHVSPRLVCSAAAALKNGTLELFEAVKSGAVPASVAERASRMPEEDQARIIESVSSGEAKTAKQVIKRHAKQVRDLRTRDRIEALPERRFPIILADPEWKQVTWSEAGQDRGASVHYSVSDAAVILGRGVPALAFDNAACYLWTTVPHEKLAHAVLEAWGFDYKSQFIWHKEYIGAGMGMGYWGRIEHEVLLIGTRGDIACALPSDRWRSVQRGAVRGHSVKPDWQYRLIEEYHPDFFDQFIELNARRRRLHWHSWGDRGYLPPPTAEELVAELAANPDQVRSDILETIAPKPGSGPIAPKRGEPMPPAKGEPIPPEEGEPIPPAKRQPPAPDRGSPIAPERGEPIAPCRAEFVKSDDLEIPQFLRRPMPIKSADAA